MPTPPPVRPTSNCTTGIFTAAPGVDLSSSANPTVVRQRAVHVDFAQLGPKADRVNLNLFEDLCIVAHQSGRQSSAGGPPSWTGVIEGSLQGTVTLVADRNTLIGSVLDPPRHYQIRLLRDTVHVVSEIDPSMYPAERAPSPGGVPPKPPPPPPAPPPPVKKPPR